MDIRDSIPELYVHLVKKDVHFYNFFSTYMHYDPYPDPDFLELVNQDDELGRKLQDAKMQTGERAPKRKD